MADISNTINKAREAAAKIADAEVVEETLPATTSNEAPLVNTSKPSMATMGNSYGISKLVENWLKVDEFGLSIDKDRKKHTEILVEIDMTEEVGFFVKDSIKWGNTPVNYASRYDGATDENGNPWADVVARAQRVDPRAKVFPSADIIMTVADPIELREGGPIAVGTKIGHTLSMSNWSEWVDFYQAVAKADRLGEVIKTKIIAKEVTGKKNQLTWGVITFEIV